MGGVFSFLRLDPRNDPAACWIVVAGTAWRPPPNQVRHMCLTRDNGRLFVIAARLFSALCITLHCIAGAGEGGARLPSGAVLPAPHDQGVGG